MEHSYNASIHTFLQQLPQAAFCLQRGIIVSCNRAAFARDIRLGTPLEDYLSHEDAMALSESKEEVRHIRLLLSDGHEPATLCQVGRQQVVTLDEIQEPLTLPGSVMVNISKGIRDPLVDLQTATASLQQAFGLTDDPGLHHVLALMERSFYRLLRLSSNLSTAGWDLTEGMVLNRQRVDVLAYFQDLFARLEPMFQMAGRRYQFKLPRNTFHGWLDVMRVEQAIMQLVSNALRFTPRGGEICLQVSRVKNKLTFTVSDQGEGIPYDMLPTVYGRFARPVRVEDPRTGVGLGLYLVRRISHLHGGDVEIEAGEEMGTVVRMTLNLRSLTGDEMAMRTPLSSIDLSGGFRHELVELSDVLPVESFTYHNL